MEPSVLRVYNELKRQNNITGFINEFAKKEGFAIWNKAIVSSNDPLYKRNDQSSIDNNGDTIVIVPLVILNDDKVNAYIKASLNDSIILNLGRSSDFSNYTFDSVPPDSLNAQKFALFMMELTEDVFGTTIYRITDSRLFADHFQSTIPDKFRLLKITDTINAGAKFGIYCESPGGAFHCIGTPPCTASYCDGCPGCVTWAAPVCWETDSPGGGGTPQPGSGGGGSGTPQCRTAAIINGEPPCPGPGTGGGWIPIPPDPPAPTSPNPPPCDKTTFLKNSPFIPVIFTELRNDATSTTIDHETGYRWIDSGPYSPKESGPPVGPNSDPQVDFPLNVMRGCMHIHFGTGTLPIFSPQDLIAAYTILNSVNSEGEDCANVNTFTYGVISHTGDSYILTIQDISAFNNFIVNKVMDPTTGKPNAEFSRTYPTYVHQNATQANAEKGFLEMLDFYGAGTALLKANNDFTGYSELKLNHGTTVTPLPCN